MKWKNFLSLLTKEKAAPLETWQNILPSLAEEKTALEQDARRVLLVNAGRMNHGKSSLFNSLLGREAFKVKDVRETRVCQQETYQDNVFVVDTPGLDADTADDAAAYEFYRRANFIFFVHNPKIGELHASELAHIEKLERLLGKKFFWQHFALVLTFRENEQEENLAAIEAQIRVALRGRFAVQNVQMFEVSNSRYARAMKERDKREREVFLEKSGIPALRQFVAEKIPEWQAENVAVQQGRLEAKKQEAKQQLAHEQEAARAVRDEKKRGGERAVQRVRETFRRAGRIMNDAL